MLQTILQAGFDEFLHEDFWAWTWKHLTEVRVHCQALDHSCNSPPWTEPPSFVPALQTPPSPRPEQMFIFREAWELVQRLGYSSNAFTHRNRDCWRRREGRESVDSVQHFSPLLSSTSYWSPKGSGLEVSSSEVSGSNLISWIWKSTTLRGPSGQTYWNPNKQACWEGAY